MRCLLGMGLLLALLMGPAYSQNNDQDWGPNPKDQAEKAEKMRRDQEIERKYEEVTKRTAPAAKAPSDPWQSIRSTSNAGKSKQ